MGASNDCALVVAPCASVRIFADGDWKHRVLVLQSRLFVTGAMDRSCFTSKCSFRGRRSTLGMVVTVGELTFGHVARLQILVAAQ